MEPAKSFRDLIVWQKAHEFVLLVYSTTKNFPKEEIYGLTSQFRRAAVSITANIAEVFVKKTKPDKIRILNIAQGSLEECRYFVIFSNELEYQKDDKLRLLSVSRILNAYIKSIEDSK
jgi:four helix bundle protein